MENKYHTDNKCSTRTFWWSRCLDAHTLLTNTASDSESQQTRMNRGKSVHLITVWWQYLLPLAWNKTQNFSKQCQNDNIKANLLLKAFKGQSMAMCTHDTIFLQFYYIIWLVHLSNIVQLEGQLIRQFSPSFCPVEALPALIF